jgi:hypothetical protein
MLRIVPHTVPRVGRSYEHFPDGLELHLLHATWKREFNLPWRKAGLLISMIKWTRTSRLSIKKPLSLAGMMPAAALYCWILEILYCTPKGCRALLRTPSTEGRSVCLCWAPSKPKGPKGRRRLTTDGAPVCRLSVLTPERPSRAYRGTSLIRNTHTPRTTIGLL